MLKTKFFDSGLRWLWVLVVIFILDRLTKELAQYYLSSHMALSVLPGFNLILSFNTGAAFGFLNHDTTWQSWFFGIIALIVSVAILVWLLQLSRREYWVCIALNLVMGGAIGNLWDRIQYGHVIDFIQLYVSHFYWPVFNIADSAICIGAIMLLVNALRSTSHRPAA